MTEDEDKTICPECGNEYTEFEAVEFIGWNGMCARCFLDRHDDQ